MSCSNCFTDTISNCQTNLTVRTLLTPATTYRWIITDKFGKKYSNTAVANASGYLVIPVTQLPEGMLTSYSGDFKMEIQDTVGKEIVFKMVGEYTCIEFTVTGGSYEKSTIGETI